ncbi:phage infection protein [Gottschalkia purinilytica]|uniref:Phage infection protein n=1 Tax=Gottschalkia purinilytica TaxID=1503 RepID=A0A0L0WA53_GOTPU|nr:YhgE/Pip domain-containing protein [Gottschalkia purinilytica]KNF08399.1 phage infection protein [Gottschalkia purinilytica]
MKNILRIYKRDIKNILSDWVVLVVILGLMILPALYAWFNIKSSWDPYGNTSGIKVAVVNNDKGDSFKGTKINVGNQLVQQLKGNKNIGWNFVSEKEADKGLKNGKYYASIKITDDFSHKLLSIVRDEQEKPSIIYSVNEKINAVAPKITQKGVTSLQGEVTKNFVKTVNGIIFDLFNKFGVELEQGKPKLKELQNLIYFVDEKIPQINKDIEEFDKGLITLNGLTKKVQGNVPLIQDSIKKGSNAANKSKDFLVRAKDGIQQAGPSIKQDLILARQITSGAENMIPEAINLINTDAPKAKEMLINIKDKFNNGTSIITNITNFLRSIDKDSNSNIIQSIINKLAVIKSNMNNKVQLINKVIDIINNGQQPSVDILNKINDLSTRVTPTLNAIINSFDSKVIPAINNITGELINVTDNAIKLLNDANEDLPVVEDLINKAYKGSEKGAEGIDLLKKKLPGIETSIHSVAIKLRKLDNDQDLNEIIKLLKNDARKESEFLSNPIEIKENRIFAIPNYGSAMSPFFTTLSLWVGTLLLVSLLSTHVKKLDDNKNLKAYEKYLGKYLTFMTIAIFQAIIVSTGDIFILKTYVSNKLVFLLFSVFISIVFSMIIYTLVSVFGNVGKALAVILLVLQISSSGGTFPIEVTPTFFQKINPMLPFTYAVSGMREAVGGVILESLRYNTIILLLYFFIFLAIGLLFKKKLDNINSKFVKRFKESGLGE